MASTAVAERTANPVQVIRQNLTQMAPEFKSALPAHVTVEKFTRVAMTAIQNNPDLQNADRRSLFGAIVRLAQDGLLPDGREAALVLFGNKAQAMPMIAGVLKKIRQSGEVTKVSAQVVYENDHFVVKYGFDEDVEHVPPPLDQPRGKPIGAYATAILKGGEQMLEVMSFEEIEKVRSVSRAKGNGPWVQWWGEMARKTVMRRLAKRLPMSTDLEDDVFRRDATMNAETPALSVVDHGPVDAQPLSSLDALESQIEDEAEIEDAQEISTNADRGESYNDTPEENARADDTIAQVEGEVDVLRGKVRDTETLAELADVEALFRQAMPRLVGEDISGLRKLIKERRDALGGED